MLYYRHRSHAHRTADRISPQEQTKRRYIDYGTSVANTPILILPQPLWITETTKSLSLLVLPPLCGLRRNTSCPISCFRAPNRKYVSKSRRNHAMHTIANLSCPQSKHVSKPRPDHQGAWSGSPSCAELVELVLVHVPEWVRLRGGQGRGGTAAEKAHTNTTRPQQGFRRVWGRGPEREREGGRG